MRLVEGWRWCTEVVLVTRQWLGVLLEGSFVRAPLLQTRGTVQTQHIDEPAPLGLQLLYLRLEIVVLGLENFGFLYENNSLFALLETTLGGGNLVAFPSSSPALLVLGR